MIRFHYHVAVVEVSRLGICRGDRLCHVFSDLPDEAAAYAELLAWASDRRIPAAAIQRARERRQHIDLWGPHLAHGGTPAPREAIRRWLATGGPL